VPTASEEWTGAFKATTGTDTKKKRNKILTAIFTALIFYPTQERIKL
jgi:hypothetical protein